MSSKLTNLFDESSLAVDDEPITADDGDTSFEIDDPDDEIFDNTNLMKKHTNIGLDGGTNEDIGQTASVIGLANSSPATIIDNCTCDALNIALNSTVEPANDASCHVCSQTTPTSKSKLSAVNTKDEDNFGTQSEEDISLATHTYSSTSTTADVADFSLTVCNAHVNSEQLIIGKLTASGAQIQMGTKVITLNAEDNLSSSIATTITEMDLDAAASVSPSTMQRIIRLQQQSYTHPTASKRHANTKTVQTESRQRTLSSLFHPENSRSNSSLPVVRTRKPKRWKWLWIVFRWICLHFKVISLLSLILDFS